jgi:hypothetical protein
MFYIAPGSTPAPSFLRDDRLGNAAALQPELRTLQRCAAMGAADTELEQILKDVGKKKDADGLEKGGKMRRGRIAGEHVKPGSTRALRAKEKAMHERAKLQLVKRGDTYLVPKTRATSVTDRQRLLARRSRGLGHAGPPAKHDYQHQTRRRTGPSGDHRSIAPHEWFAWQAGQGEAPAVGPVGGKQPRAVGGSPPPRRAVAESASEPVVSPVPAGAADEPPTAVRRSGGRRTTGSPWAGSRGSPSPVALTPDARVSRDRSALSLSGGSVETGSRAAQSPAAGASGRAQAGELPSERIKRMAGEPLNKFLAQDLDNSSSHLGLGLEPETGVLSPMGVDLSRNHAAAHRKYRTNGHRSGSFTAAPTHPALAGRPHATRTAPAEGRVQQRRMKAGVEPSSYADTSALLDSAALENLEAGLAAADASVEAIALAGFDGTGGGTNPTVRQSSSAFQVKPSDTDPDLRSLSALELQTKWNQKMTALEIVGCQSKQGWIPRDRPGSGSRRLDRPPSAPLERRRQASAQKGKKGDLKSRGALRPPSREGSTPQRYESPREVVPTYRSGVLLRPEALLTEKVTAKVWND